MRGERRRAPMPARRRRSSRRQPAAASAESLPRGLFPETSFFENLTHMSPLKRAAAGRTEEADFGTATQRGGRPEDDKLEAFEAEMAEPVPPRCGREARERGGPWAGGAEEQIVATEDASSGSDEGSASSAVRLHARRVYDIDQLSLSLTSPCAIVIAPACCTRPGGTYSRAPVARDALRDARPAGRTRGPPRGGWLSALCFRTM